MADWRRIRSSMRTPCSRPLDLRQVGRSQRLAACMAPCGPWPASRAFCNRSLVSATRSSAVGQEAREIGRLGEVVPSGEAVVEGTLGAEGQGVLAEQRAQLENRRVDFVHRDVAANQYHVRVGLGCRGSPRGCRSGCRTSAPRCGCNGAGGIGGAVPRGGREWRNSPSALRRCGLPDREAGSPRSAPRRRASSMRCRYRPWTPRRVSLSGPLMRGWTPY